MATISRTCFVWRNKGEDVPLEFATQVVSAYPSWGGLVFVDDGEILMDSEAKTAKIEGIKKICEGNTDKAIGFVFGKETDTTVNPKNMQPFPIITVGEGDQASDKVVVIVDGPFEQYGTNPDSTGRPYLFMNTYLRPKFQAIWAMVGGDAQKFIEAITQKYCHDEILAAGGPGSCVAVITCAAENGTTVFMHPDCNSDEYTWGFTNECLQYSENNEDAEAAASAAAATTKGKPRLSLSGDDASGVKPGNQTPSGATSAVVWQGRIPDNVTTNKDKRELYAKFHGNGAPGGWKNSGDSRPWVAIIPELVDDARKAGWTLRTAPHIASVEPIKPAAAPVQGSPAAAASEVLDAVVKDKTLKFIQAIDSNTLRVMTPEQMSKNEKERVTFWDQFGVKYTEVIRWNKNTIEELCKNFPNTAAPHLVLDLFNIIYNLEQDLEKVTAPPAAAPVAAPAAAPAVTAPPAAAPPKRRFQMG